MRFQYFLLLIFLIPSLAIAQPYNSNAGRFRVAERKGCAPFTVNITYTDSTPFDPTWGDGSIGPTSDTTHVYNQPGSYTLSILFPTGGSDVITLTVTPSIQPDFDIYTCNGQAVQVKVLDTNYDSYVVNYGDMTAEALIATTDDHSYALPNTYTIALRGKNDFAADNCASLSKQVDVTNPLSAPAIDLLTVLSNSQVSLNFNNVSNNVQYRLEYATNASPSFGLSQYLNDVTSVIATNSSIRTEDNYYCFRLGAYDPCGNGPTQYSDTICSVEFEDPDNSTSDELNLSWNSSTSGVSNFDVRRDGSSIGTTGALSFTDATVLCKTNYCYRILTNYPNGSQSISIEKCETATSTIPPTAIQNVTAAVGSGGVDLTWQQNDPDFQAVEYSIFRKSGLGSFTLLDKTPTLSFTDTDYSTDESFCYRINYKDICDNVSLIDPIADACPIRLTGSISNDNIITLNWSAYSGWQNLNHYTVEKYDAEGVLLVSIDVGTDLTYEDATSDPDNQLYVYIVTATSDDPVGLAVSNEFTIIKQPNLFYPKAFTPNGDNLNDTFIVFGQFIDKFEMNIFNRWGELLYHSKDLTLGWDGKFRGVEQPEGTYTFIANLTDLEGRTFKRSGSVVLLRKKPQQ